MIEPAVFLRHLLGEPAQRRLGAVDCARAWLPAAGGGDAQPAQSEANGRDAADMGGVFAGGTTVGARAVADDAGADVRLLPEERKRPPRQILEKPVVRLARPIGGRRGRGAPGNARLRAAGVTGDERDENDPAVQSSSHYRRRYTEWGWRLHTVTR